VKLKLRALNWRKIQQLYDARKRIDKLESDVGLV
jgi:hypothetical protein